MKSARISFWTNQYKQQGDRKPDFTGQLEIPSALAMEMFQAFQSGQGLTTNQQTGEQTMVFRVSAWRNMQQGPQQPIMSGQIEAPSEAAARLAARQQAPAQAAPAPAPAAFPAAPAPAPMAAPPMAAPAAAPAPAPGGWGGGGGWGSQPAF